MKVMLAATLKDVSQLRFPMLASPKLDGIRAVVLDGVVYSRNGKPIPNRWVQKEFGIPGLNGLDGELIVGDPTAPNCYRETMSGCMSQDGEPRVVFYAFDCVLGFGPYEQRQQAVQFFSKHQLCVQEVEQTTIVSADELARLEARYLAEGYEGVMLRARDGLYKNGRSTMREQYLVKVKRFEDAEAVVIDCEERMHNGNEATKDELGRTKRSTHKAGKSGRGDLGALVCRTKDGVVFNIGTGFDDQEREQHWNEYLGGTMSPVGRKVKYKFFPSGSKEAPRFPVFLGFRDWRDAP